MASRDRKDKPEAEDPRDHDEEESSTAAADSEAENPGDDDDDDEGAEPKKAAAPGDRGDDDSDDDDDDDAPSKGAAPVEKKSAARKPAGARRAPGIDPKRPVAGRPRPAAAAAATSGGSLGKSMVLFLLIVGGLGGAFWALGGESGGGSAPAPKWKVGQVAEVELTLVSTDKQDLSCASAEGIADRRCAFEGPDKPGPKEAAGDDKKLLRPYTTVDRVQFLAAGLWSEPALSGTLPPTRFSVKCKYTVEGKVKKPSVRWSSTGEWHERTEEWYAGVVSDCKLP